MNRTKPREEKWLFPFVEYSNIKGNEKPPLIFQLHGAGERGVGKDELSKVEVNGLPKTIADKKLACIVILPQCSPDTF